MDITEPASLAVDPAPGLEIEFALVDLLGTLDPHVRPIRVWWATETGSTIATRNVVLFDADYLSPADAFEITAAINAELVDSPLDATACPVRRQHRPSGNPGIYAPFHGPVAGTDSIFLVPPLS